jgi:hypothetical protein
MSKPKLALIPSGYKSGKVYSILPNNATGDFDFTRQSIGTRVRKDGLIEEVTNDVPRLDWLNSSCPSLLLEPQRTNAFTYSEQFNQSAWFKSSATITTNQIIAPNGTLTADLLTSTANGGGVYKFSTWDTTQKTVSIFVKKNTSSTVEIFNGSSSTNRVVFDLDSGTITTEGGTMTGTIDNFANGWYRLSATHTATASQTFAIKPETNESVYIWGAQIENASYSSSYIKTEASTVTRLKDECINGGDSDLFNVSELSWFVDATNFATPLNNYCYVTITDGQSTPVNMIRLTYETNRIIVGVYDNGTFELSYNITGVTANQRNKVLLTLNGNEAKVYFNGFLKTTSTGVVIPTGLDSLSFTSRTEDGRNFEGKVHDTRFYNRVLTEAEAIQLTAL